MYLLYTIIVLCQDKGGKNMPRIIDGDKNNIIGENLGRIRVQKKLSQQELSNKLETLAVYICRGSISRIELGQRTVTDIELAGLAEILNVSLDELFKKA